MVQAYRAALPRSERLVLVIAVNAAERGREVSRLGESVFFHVNQRSFM